MLVLSSLCPKAGEQCTCMLANQTAVYDLHKQGYGDLEELERTGFIRLNKSFLKQLAESFCEKIGAKRVISIRSQHDGVFADFEF